MQTAPLVLLAGCALSACSLAPATRLPEPAVSSSAVIADELPAEFGDSEETGACESLEWWRAFADPVLDTIVESVLTSNHDMAVAVDVLHLEARPGGGVAEGEAVREPGARVELVGDQDGRRVVAAGRVVGRADRGRIEQSVAPRRVVDAADRRVDAGRDRHAQLKADVEPGTVPPGRRRWRQRPGQGSLQPRRSRPAATGEPCATTPCRSMVRCRAGGRQAVPHSDRNRRRRARRRSGGRRHAAPPPGAPPGRGRRQGRRRQRNFPPARCTPESCSPPPARRPGGVQVGQANRPRPFQCTGLDALGRSPL